MKYLLLLLCALLCDVLHAADKPNIVFILVDDMGFSDLGCYGSEIPTPNLNALAAKGVRFTQFYNTARCCPTRAALLTGLYSHQAGVGHMMEDKGAPGYLGHLNVSCVTIAEVLKPAGYFTAMAGKWHVGQQAGVEGMNGPSCYSPFCLTDLSQGCWGWPAGVMVAVRVRGWTARWGGWWG
jgi:arylsulfatase